MNSRVVPAGRVRVAALVLAVAWAGPAEPAAVTQEAQEAPKPVVGEPRVEPAGMSPQRATADDMHVFDPYIGRFRSKTFHDDASGKAFHYVVEYRWFGAQQSIVEFTVSTAVEGKQTLNARGFYGYDPFNQRLYATAAFSSGVSGFGSVGEFDRKTRRRVTWARSRGPDGPTTYVRDAFEVVDENAWKDVTSVREGEQGEWRVVYEDTFTRIQE
jgi:hypothetical protein